MGFMSHRRKDVEVQPEMKWDFITLNDFKSTSCFTPFAYASLWISLFISLAVYAVDTFTAVQLLAFNRWSGTIELTQLISFDISKWIFSVCIILSFINLGFEHIRARKVMNRGSVAECFLDSLAARLESIRMGRGRGWRRFLVFAELTKSKRGSEYVALFTYFSFQSWIRVLVCSGPRQVINALTLYSVYKDASNSGVVDSDNVVLSFFDHIGDLATKDVRQTLILSGMLFTLVIWVFSFLSLLLAALFFVFFLWAKIPREDGGLTGFCERKVNKRLKKIVSVKINKAMAEDERKRKKAEFKAAKKNGGDRPLTMQATLPNLNMDMDKLPEMPMLNRNDTTTTLPAYTSRPPSPGSFELNTLDQKRPQASRTTTTSSAAPSYSSKTSLLGSAAEPGMDRSASPAPTLSPIDYNVYPPARTGTAASNRSFAQGPRLQRMASNGSGLGDGYFDSPATYSNDSMPPLPTPVRSPTYGPDGYRGSGSSQPNARPYPGGGRPPYDDFSNGRGSPAPSANSYRNGPLSPQGTGPDGYPIRSTTTGPGSVLPQRGPNGYPMRSATNPMPPRGPQQYPQRNMTAPFPPQQQQQQQQWQPDARMNGSYAQQQQPPQFSSNGSVRSNAQYRPQHQQSDSNGSLAIIAQYEGQHQHSDSSDSTRMNAPFQPQHQPSGSNGSMRNLTPQGGQQPYRQTQDSRDYDYTSRPMTASSQRSAPRGGYGNGSNGGNGWNQDVERGNGPRY
ncbi:hypothetical protein B0T17DRAFT_633476 [Bombardia bombarda]|uniref:Pheromone-regulated membrane protein n=1 Tax=Bombardia bombarda TaxID=252184 RepID=A0AA39X852_9PEZI|nr:hypothetical protein B0T17DRAFT_633476 [Bombardia bombarda]